MKTKTTRRIYIYILILCLLVFSIILFVSLNHAENDTIDDNLICQSAQRAVNYLRRLQHDNGQIILVNYKVFNVWETIQAARAISLWQNKTDLKRHPILQSALTFLKNSETSFGMVLHNSDHKNSYCIETSSEYIRLLAFLENRNTIEQGALASTNTAPLDLDAALQYLKESQNEEGHWGIVWQYYGTPYYAMAPILEAMHYHNADSSFDAVINKAKNFLLASQRKDGSFSYKSEKNQNRPSVELETTLGLRSLLSCNAGCDDIGIKRGINWLLRNQRKDGSWNGGIFPLPNPRYKKKEDIFCTSQVLILLYEYLNIKDK